MKPMINLPFGESLKRTYLYVFANFGKAMKICSFWIVLMLAADVLMSFPSQCREGQNCIGWQSNVSLHAAVGNCLGSRIGVFCTDGHFERGI